MENLVSIFLNFGNLLTGSEIFVAIVTAFSTAGGTVFLQKYRERRKAWNAVQAEIKSNKRRVDDLIVDLFEEAHTRNQVGPTNFIGEVNSLKMTSYENAVNSGFLISLSDDLQDDIFDHYEKVEKINGLIELKQDLEDDIDILSLAFAVILQSTVLMSDKQEINAVKESVQNFQMRPQNQQTKRGMISTIEEELENVEKGYKFDNLEENLSNEVGIF